MRVRRTADGDSEEITPAQRQEPFLMDEASRKKRQEELKEQLRQFEEVIPAAGQLRRVLPSTPPCEERRWHDSALSALLRSCCPPHGQCCQLEALVKGHEDFNFTGSKGKPSALIQQLRKVPPPPPLPLPSCPPRRGHLQFLLPSPHAHPRI